MALFEVDAQLLTDLLLRQRSGIGLRELQFQVLRPRTCRRHAAVPTASLCHALAGSLSSPDSWSAAGHPGGNPTDCAAIIS